MSLMIKAGGALAIIGGVSGYSFYDKTANFVPVDARITMVEHLCYLEKREYRQRHVSDPMRCEAAAQAVKTAQQWDGYEVKRITAASFVFQSPASGKVETAKVRMERDVDHSGLKAGTVKRMLASKSEATRLRLP